MERVLVADDQQEFCQGIVRALSRKGYAAKGVFDGSSALAMLHADFHHLLISDVMLPRLNGFELLRATQRVSPSTKVLLMSGAVPSRGHLTADEWVKAEHLIKPFSLEAMECTVARMLSGTTGEERVCQVAPEPPVSFGRLIGGSAAMREVHHLLSRVAGTNAPVLILGASGTGKELVAREIHERSGRAAGPFVAVNCVALLDNLLESELFGHERGAFTGAVQEHKGKCELAHGGTLFLDEIGEMNERTQVKLLRFLQEHEFQRVGGNATIHVDVRILAATNRDLAHQVAAGKFREDLYYRLNMFPLLLPPLAQREGDIETLAQFIVEQQNRAMGRQVSLTPECIVALEDYDWPGNVRELENVIGRAMILADDRYLTPAHLPEQLVGGGAPVRGARGPRHGTLQTCVATLEIESIRKVLEVVRWNQTEAARRLGMKRTSLQYKINKYLLRPPAGRKPSA